MSKADEIKEILEVVEELDKITPEQLDKAIKEADKYYQELRLDRRRR